MKGLLFPAIAALSLHALLLRVEVDWGKEEPLSPPSPICLSLSCKPRNAPEKPSPKPAEELPKAPGPLDQEIEVPKGNPVFERKSLSPKKTSPRSAPRNRAAPQPLPPPAKAETQAVGNEPLQGETEPKTPSPPAAATTRVSTATGSEALTPSPVPVEEKAYSKQAVPLYLRNPPPQYPSAARRRGYEGTVVLEVLVDREGMVRELTLFQSSGHQVLDRAAMQAVKGWLFEPARRGEEKAEMRVKVPLTFRLQ